MITIARQLFVAAVLTFIGGAAAEAQAPMTPAAPPQAASAAPATAAQLAVEQRISALAAKLAITADQAPDWNTFAQAMRDNAAGTDQLFQQRAQGTATMSAVDNMKSYAAIARAYADSTEHLSAAFETLYGKLLPAQKQTADEVFRQPPATPQKHSSRHH